MAWKVDYTGTAKAQLKSSTRAWRRRVVDFMDKLVATTDPRRVGRALTGPLGHMGRCRVGHSGVVCELQMPVFGSWW